MKPALIEGKRLVMIIRMRKSGHLSVITCARDDGSVTYQKTRHAGFFPRHDLMHYAVESSLGLKESFYGLIAGGWSLEAFTEPGVSRRLPLEAKQTELMVGEIDRLVMFHEPVLAGPFHSFMQQATGGKAMSTPLTQGQLDTIVNTFNSLHSAYLALEEGQEMTLVFPEASGGYTDGIENQSAQYAKR
jgi:hypothetical protein